MHGGRWACAWLLLAVVGCGGGRGELKGKITYGAAKKTVVTGSIQAVGADGIPQASIINNDGSYHIKGLPVGKVEISISSADPAVGPKMRKKEEQPAGQKNPDWFPLPTKYSDFKTSGLTFDVKSGLNTFDISLSEK